MLKTQLFTEKYRPNQLVDMVLPKKIINQFNNGIELNYIFYGSPGTGKTSLAKSLINQFKYPYIYINSSLDTSIEVIRTKIIDFCSNYSIIDGEKKMKIVFLDEVENASNSFFDALRATIEKFSSNTRFILTTNYINEIPDPIISRCKLINFDFSKDEETELKKLMLLRIKNICNTESINIENNALLELVNKNYPDIRTILTTLNGFKLENIDIVKLEHLKNFYSTHKPLYELIFNSINPVDNYKIILSEYSNNFLDVIQSLGDDFIEYIIKSHETKVDLIPNILIIVAKYQCNIQNCVDPVRQLLACVYELQILINRK